MCKSRDRKWASLALDLCPVVDGKATKPLDVRSCKALAFWARTDQPNGARVKVIFRGALGEGNLPQASVGPTPVRIRGQWQQHSVSLQRLARKVDLSKLVQIGLEFGAGVGNPQGTVIYVDDFHFIGINRGKGPGLIPAVDPQHWPFGSVAGTSWLIFVELGINPFDLRSEKPAFPVEGHEGRRGEGLLQHD